MKKLYLVTGATGHVGTILIEELLSRGEHVRALLYAPAGETAPDGVEACYGDITNIRSLQPFFDRTGYDYVTMIHCAAYITIASGDNPRVWDTNVNGTRNIMAYCLAKNVDRVVYVSSVHAIPVLPKPEVMTEVDSFSPDRVYGQYAKSKAAAAQIALDYAKKGLNVSLVHPSGVIGPGDTLVHNHMIRTIRAMMAGLIPIGLEGGYDFVDSRDVVAGILACEQHGRAGECYLLNGHYVTVLDLVNMIRAMKGKKPTSIELPYALVEPFSPLAEKVVQMVGNKPPLFTPYSMYTLHINGAFSHEKATKEFGFNPRPLEESIRASL